MVGPVTSLAAIGWPIVDRIHVFDRFAVSPRGIGIAVGFLLGSVWFLREAPKRGVVTEHVDAMLLWALVGGLIGARLGYVIGHGSEFHSVGDALSVTHGGMSLYGGIAGGLVAIVPLMRRNGHRVFQVTDGAAAGMALGIAVGRVGGLVAGDALGRPTSWALAFRYEGGVPAGFSCSFGRCSEVLEGGRQLVLTRHGADLFSATGQLISRGTGVQQTGLYDVVGALLLFAFLLWFGRVARREGVVSCAWIVGYGSVRFVSDLLGVDRTFLGLTWGQWTSAAAVVVALALLARWAMVPRVAASRPLPEAGLPTTAFTPPRVPGGV